MRCVCVCVLCVCVCVSSCMQSKLSAEIFAPAQACGVCILASVDLHGVCVCACTKCVELQSILVSVELHSIWVSIELHSICMW